MAKAKNKKEASPEPKAAKPSTVWSGTLAFGLVSFPVRLHSGARAEHTSFNRLCGKCHGRVNEQIFCKTCEAVQERSTLLKGYEYSKDKYVIVEEKELDDIQPDTARAMEIAAFVPASQVDPIYFESSFFLAPDEGGQGGYGLLLAAMKDSEQYAIAKVTIRNREHTIAIRPYRRGLLVHTLFLANEVRSFLYPELPATNSNDVTLCKQLIATLAEPFAPAGFIDSFESNLQKLIRRKIAGAPAQPQAKKPAQSAPADIMDAVRQSIAQASGKSKKSNGHAIQ